MKYFLKINTFLFIIFIIILGYFLLNKDYEKIIYLGYTIGISYFLLICIFLIDIFYNTFKVKKKYKIASIINLKEAKETNLDNNSIAIETYVYKAEII